jgi:hypothetical protein
MPANALVLVDPPPHADAKTRTATRAETRRGIEFEPGR